MTVMPRDHEWTVDDLARAPDDGLRYELVDGVLLVSAAPSTVHQIVLVELLALLREACPPDARTLVAPTDYQPTRRRSLQPDVLVAWRRDVGAALQDGAYVDAGYAEGRQQLHIDRPFGVTVTPQDLLDP